VLGCLRDHLHDDTLDGIARLLGMPIEDVEVALTALAGATTVHGGARFVEFPGVHNAECSAGGSATLR
jgi:hypothetical protein